MFLEVLHPVFGYTKGSFLKNLALVGGRNFVIFVLIESEPRMHEKPVVFYLMMTYATLEIIRYPYHLLRVYDIEVIKYDDIMIILEEQILCIGLNMYYLKATSLLCFTFL